MLIAQGFFFFFWIKETEQSYKESFGPPKTGETIHTHTKTTTLRVCLGSVYFVETKIFLLKVL